MEGGEPGSVVRAAHLVGSVPLPTSEGVFRAAMGLLGPCLRRVPDGETGARKLWIAGQLETFRGIAQLESEVTDIGYLKRAKFRLKQGQTLADFPELGYSAAALASYAVFRRLKDEGCMRPEVRFQVCLPTPLAALHAYIYPDSLRSVTGAYEARMRSELDEIAAHIPHAELAVQWDTAIEFAVLEGIVPTVLSADEILGKLTEYGEWVPEAVELGYHLCYGDAGHKHFKEPVDASLLVAVANSLARTLRRTLQWIHLPVPRGRLDDDYYRPLANLALRPETELYLGLIHMTDGEAGARKRMAHASRFVDAFGIATECGLGRRPSESVEPLLKLHALLARA